MMELTRWFIKAATLIAASSWLALGAHAEENRVPAGLPETDIFLFDIQWDEMPVLTNVRNVTDRPGYDNQPSFTPDGQTFLFSRGDLYQTDVYEYDIEDETFTQITDTEISEFSPMASPDNKTISFVSDGPGAYQNIARITRSKPAQMDKLLPSPSLREPVGYYAWDHANDHVLFWSRYGFNVTFAHAGEDETFYVTGNAVPSTPHLIPGTNNFSFVHRQGNGQVWIKQFDPGVKTIRPLTAIAGQNANYGWAPDGSIMIIQNDVLMRWKEGETDGWETVIDLDGFGIKDASRLTISPDGAQLAIVGLPK